MSQQSAMPTDLERRRGHSHQRGRRREMVCPAFGAGTSVGRPNADAGSDGRTPRVRAGNRDGRMGRPGARHAPRALWTAVFCSVHDPISEVEDKEAG